VSYRVFLTEKFKSSLSRVANPLQGKIHEKVRTYVAPQLCREPHFGLNIKKLRGWSPDTWRYRIGNFRLFYRIDEENKVTVLLEIEDRKEAY
jgi:mRNA interferase RelE/StbE